MIAYSSDTTYTGTYSSGPYDNDVAVFYSAADAFHDFAEEMKKLLALRYQSWYRFTFWFDIRLGREPISPPKFFLAFAKPFLVYRMMRCNRHGIGLRTRIK